MDVIMDAREHVLSFDQEENWNQNLYGYVADKAHGTTPYADHHFSESLNNTFLEVLKLKNHKNDFVEWDTYMNAYNLIDRNSTVDILFSSKLLFIKQ